MKKKLLLVLFGLLVGTLMSEVFLRVIGFSYPLFYTADYYLGYALRPGAEGLYQREGHTYIRINSDGWRDREHQQTKPANVVRIAVIGDSYVEALQVPMEQTFWWLLPQRLEECKAYPGKHVEIVSFGVSGYGTAQELITLQQRVWQYSPDVVLLAVTTNNDVTDNLRALKNVDEIPYFVHKNGQLVIDNSFRDSATFRERNSSLNRIGNWIHNHLRVVQLIHYAQFVARVRVTDWRNRRRLAQTQATPVTAAPLAVRNEDISIENMVYLEPRDENWREAWRVTEGLIKQMHDEVQEHGAKFLVVTVSNAIQVYPDPVLRQNFMKYLAIDNVFYPNLRLKAMADREHIDFLDLAAPMQAYADQNKVFLHGFGSDIGNGHWNVAGHRVAAELIAQKFCVAR